MEVLTKPEHENPAAFFSSDPNSNAVINSPVVEYTNDKRRLKITSFFSLGNETYNNDNKPAEASERLRYKSVKSHELTLVDNDDDSMTGETLQLPKVTPYMRKFPLNASAANAIRSTSKITTTTAVVTKTTTPMTAAASTIKTTVPLKSSTKIRYASRDPGGDNFRIIVEPIAIYKKLAGTTQSTLTTTKSTLLPSGHKLVPNSLPLGDKFSAASHYRSQFNTNFTYFPYTTIMTTMTTTTTTAKSTTLGSVLPRTWSLSSKTATATDADKPNTRRFYIPRADSLERKLQFPATSTSSLPPSPPTPMPTLLKPDLFRSLVRKVSSSTPFPRPYYTRNRDKDDDEDEKENEDENENEKGNGNDSTRNSKAVSATSSVRDRNNGANSNDNDTVKLYEDNEILYYDDYYEDTENVRNNDDNYIDNKIGAEYSTPTARTNNVDLSAPKSTVKSSPKANTNNNLLLTKTPTATSTATATPSTAVNLPKSFPVFSSSPNSLYDQSASVSTTTIASKGADSNIKRLHRFKESNAQRCPQCNEKPFVRYADSYVPVIVIHSFCARHHYSLLASHHPLPTIYHPLPSIPYLLSPFISQVSAVLAEVWSTIYNN